MHDESGMTAIRARFKSLLAVVSWLTESESARGGPAGAVVTAGLVLLHAVSFALLCLVVFSRNEAFLFHGLDGSYMLALARQQLQWTSFEPGFGSNFLQSLGNIWFPLNAHAIPGYALASVASDTAIDPVRAYTTFALELFLATAVIARAIGAGWAAALTSAWLLPLIAYPVAGLPVLYAVMALVPHLGTVIVVTALTIVLFGRVGTGTLQMSIGCAAGLVACVLYISIATPTVLVLIAPVLLAFGLSALVSAESAGERKVKIAVAVVAVGTLALNGVFHYAAGLLRFTAVNFFPGDFFNDRMSLAFASIAFHGGWGTVLYSLGSTGALIAAVIGRGTARSLGVATLACAGGVALFGLANWRFDFWHGPSPLYFEFLLWPFFTAFAVALLAQVARTLARQMGWRRPKLEARSGGHRLKPLLLAAVLPWAIVLPAKSTESRQPRFHPYPPPRSPIVALLEREIGLKPGTEFRGRVATFTGRRRLDIPVSWLDLHAVDYQIIRRLGNDHRMVGLWYYDIPTLTEYSPLITPPFHLFTKTLFSLPADRQIRTVMTLRHPAPRLLAAIGVRFVVTDAPMSDAVLRATAPMADLGDLYLFELSSPNIGQYSPLRPIPYRAAAEALAILQRPDFDPIAEVAVRGALSETLRPAISSRMYVLGEALRIEATSEGRSLLVLPVEFSHCLELRVATGGGPPPRVLEVNLFQTGILFERQLDASLHYFTGPFHNSTCRLQDATAFKAQLLGTSR